jgi:hypothetical protein
MIRRPMQQSEIEVLLMRRALGLASSLSLVLVFGCAQRYDYRLEKTIENRKYQRRLDTNLGGAPGKGKIQDVGIYVRPPKGLTGPTQTFAMAVVEPGKYDVENSFIDEKRGASLHVLARVKTPKAPAAKTKKGAATEATPRGDFRADVIDLLRSVYSVEIANNQLKDVKKQHDARSNTFKSPLKPLETGDTNAPKELQVFFYGDKNGPYEIALIFEYPKTEHDFLSPKIDLCLESFGVGDLAKRLYSGGEEAAAEEGPIPTGAF